MNDTNKPLTLGSLFSGSGGFELGAVISGIVPVWNSEIEPFAIAVTRKRFPSVRHYGDVSTLDGAELEPVDIITFGSPCQDMSIAGKRAGLEGSRSNLFYEAIRIVKEMRDATNGEYPRYIVWENVPGAFSSNKGEDFRSVLEAICSIKDENVHIPRHEKWTAAGEIVADGYSIAWRLLDAQYWGVPQRRKRIYLVADFTGGSAGKILFESEGVSGYSAESFRAWQRTAQNLETGIGETSCLCLNDQGGRRDVTSTLRGEAHHPPLVFENHSQDTRYTELKGIAPSVLSTYGTGGNNQPFVLETPKTLKIRSGCAGGGKGALIQEDKSATLSCNNYQTVFVPAAYGICSKDSNSMKSDNPHSGIYKAETARTLDGNGGNPGCNQGGIAVIEGSGARPSHHGNGYKESDVMYTLNTVEHHAVAYDIDRAAFNQGRNAQFSIAVDKEVEPPIVARGPGAVAHSIYHSSKNSYHTNFSDESVTDTLVATDYKDPPTVSEEPYYIVRRLTPTECARLQGFPDRWCCGLETDEPTEADLEFWRNVFETHRKIVTDAKKAKTDKQIIKWLKNPHSDSAEYKLWGNGVALPNVVFVLSGIVSFAER